MSESNPPPRRRWISLGELIALGALVISALGLWITWKATGDDKPTRLVEQRQAIPLTLRGKAEDDGRALEISPVEPSHALDSLRITIKGASPIELGGDGRLAASDLESVLKSRDPDEKGAHRLPVRIDARYVEAGAERRGGGAYTIGYRWEGGGLFGGHSLRLTGLSRG
jgi:hypothetical protein